jgi:hypothetical protein
VIVGTLVSGIFGKRLRREEHEDVIDFKQQNAEPSAEPNENIRAKANQTECSNRLAIVYVTDELEWFGDTESDVARFHDLSLARRTYPEAYAMDGKRFVMLDLDYFRALYRGYVVAMRSDQTETDTGIAYMERMCDLLDFACRKWGGYDALTKYVDMSDDEITRRRSTSHTKIKSKWRRR